MPLLQNQLVHAAGEGKEGRRYVSV